MGCSAAPLTTIQWVLVASFPTLSCDKMCLDMTACPWGHNCLSEVHQCTDMCVGGSVCVSGDGTLKGPTYPRELPHGTVCVQAI